DGLAESRAPSARLLSDPLTAVRQYASLYWRNHKACIPRDDLFYFSVQDAFHPYRSGQPLLHPQRKRGLFSSCSGRCRIGDRSDASGARARTGAISVSGKTGFCVVRYGACHCARVVPSNGGGGKQAIRGLAHSAASVSASAHRSGVAYVRTAAARALNGGRTGDNPPATAGRAFPLLAGTPS